MSIEKLQNHYELFHKAHFSTTNIEKMSEIMQTKWAVL